MSIAEDIMLQAFMPAQDVFAETVTYKVGGIGAGTAISAIVDRRIPDAIEANGKREDFVWTLHVLDADMPSPTDNDTVVIGSDTWQIISIGIVAAGHRELAIAAPQQIEVSDDGYRVG